MRRRPQRQTVNGNKFVFIVFVRGSTAVGYSTECLNSYLRTVGNARLLGGREILLCVKQGTAEDNVGIEPDGETLSVFSGAIAAAEFAPPQRCRSPCRRMRGHRV